MANSLHRTKSTKLTQSKPEQTPAANEVNVQKRRKTRNSSEPNCLVNVPPNEQERKKPGRPSSGKSIEVSPKCIAKQAKVASKSTTNSIKTKVLQFNENAVKQDTTQGTPLKAEVRKIFPSKMMLRSKNRRLSVAYVGIFRRRPVKAVQVKKKFGAPAIKPKSKTKQTSQDKQNPPEPKSSHVVLTSDPSASAKHINEPHTTTQDEEKTSQEVMESLNVNLRSYRAVCNIGYSVVEFWGQKKIVYKCFIPGCSFVLMDEKLFEKHLQHTHVKVKWRHGFCCSCQGFVAYDKVTIQNEFEHLFNSHARYENIFGVEPVEVLLPPDDHNYNENVDNEKISIRPWLLENQNVKLQAPSVMMINENALAATFKCMDKFCAFFTSDAEIFRAHFEFHEKDYQERTREQTSKACCYCFFKANDINELIDHVQSIHKYDIYQCMYCFYRSVSFGNVQNHIEVFHPNKNAMAIECAPTKRKSKSQAITEIQNSDFIKASVPPMVCCNKKFFQLEDLRTHMKTHEGEPCGLHCNSCKESIEWSTYEKHSLACFKIGMFQCAYCLFGSNTLDPLKLHFANNHQTQFPIYCERNSNVEVKTVNDLCLASHFNFELFQELQSVTINSLSFPDRDFVTIRRDIRAAAIVNAENVERINFWSP